MRKSEEEIAKFLIQNVESVKGSPFGTFYRASAYLRDGTYLPCVMFGNPGKLIELATRRLAELTKDEYQYKLVLGSFVIRGSTVPIYEVSRVELSPYAWSEEILRRIHGETTMGWTSFTAKMKDGKIFSFGTTFSFEFFDLPEGYSYNDIVEIHSGMVADENGVEKKFFHDWSGKYYREKPFFYCYSEFLPAS
jgi:hypothetical protein